MATKPFLLVMKLQYDPISPVQISPALQSGVVTSVPGNSMPLPVGSVMSGYGSENLATAGLGDTQSTFGGGASIFALFGNLLASYLNYFNQKKLQKQQQDFQKEYFDYTFGKQSEEKWKEIYYNDPWRQLQRLKSAGLNENLMYGTLGNLGTATGNAPANPPGGLSGSIPTISPFFDFSSPIQALLNPLQALSQIGLNKSQAFKNYKSAGVDEQQANRLSTLTPLEAQKYQFVMDNLQDQNTLLQSYIQQSIYDEEQKRTYLYFIDKMYDAQVREANARAFSYSASAQMSLAQVDKIEEELNTIFPELARMYRASASEKFQIANSIAKKLPDELRQIAAYADVSEKDVENYFWVRLMPSYFAPVVNAGGNVGSAYARGMKK